MKKVIAGFCATVLAVVWIAMGVGISPSSRDEIDAGLVVLVGIWLLLPPYMALMLGGAFREAFKD